MKKIYFHFKGTVATDFRLIADSPQSLRAKLTEMGFKKIKVSLSVGVCYFEKVTGEGTVFKRTQKNTAKCFYVDYVG